MQVKRTNHIQNFLTCFLTGLWLILFSFLPLPVFAQNNTTNAPNSAGANSGNETNQISAKELKELEADLERRIKFLLYNVSDDLVARRLPKTAYTIQSEVGINRRKLKDWALAFNETELSTLKSELLSRDYEGLRNFTQDVGITVGFSKNISRTEWEPIITSIQALFESSGSSAETVEGQNIELPETPEERMLKQSIEEARDAIERAGEQRKSEIELTKRLELQHGKELQKKVEDELRQDLLQEKNKLKTLVDQMFNDGNLKEKLVREWPFLNRFLYSGMGIGALVVVAGLLLGFFVFFGIRSLGSSFVVGTEGIAEALKAGKDVSGLQGKKDVDPFEPENKEVDDELEEDAVIEFDAKPEFKEAAEQLKFQVLRDISTSGALLSKVAEQEKCGEVVGIFDVLGPEISLQVFDQFTSSAKRTLQRAFFNGEIKRVKVATLFNRVNELRTLLSTTDILMREKSDKTFAQIAISYSEAEIAKALKEINSKEASQILSIFPPDRMIKILHEMGGSAPKEILQIMGRTVSEGVQLSVDLVKRFSGNFMDESKIRFEEQKRYFKSLIAASDVDEAEIITKGLEFNPRLLLEVNGIRATIDDLWAQASETIDSLLSIVELEASSYLLFLAPANVRSVVLDGYPDRKRTLTLDALENFSRDEELKQNAAKNVNTTKKLVLGRLTDLAIQGAVKLPSYELLLQKVKAQEDTEKVSANARALDAEKSSANETLTNPKSA